MSTRIDRIETKDSPAPGGHYAQATAWDSLVFVSGQLPITADGKPLNSSFDEQARLALANLLAIVVASGGTAGSVLKVNAYIVGIEHWPAFNRIFAEAFGDARPARAVIPVPALHHDLLIEVDAMAVRPPV